MAEATLVFIGILFAGVMCYSLYQVIKVSNTSNNHH